jgi:hypothetical protein
MLRMVRQPAERCRRQPATQAATSRRERGGLCWSVLVLAHNCLLLGTVNSVLTRTHHVRDVVVHLGWDRWGRNRSKHVALSKDVRSLLNGIGTLSGCRKES